MHDLCKLLFLAVCATTLKGMTARICTPITSTKSWTAECFFKDKITNCTNPVDGMRVVISCRKLYEDDRLKENPYRYCEDGTWDYPISSGHCKPVCGLKQENTDASYPWQVDILTSNQKICVGSIISRKVIITAAQCLQKGKEYSVSSGAHNAKVERFFVDDSYSAEGPSLAYDIGFLILESPFPVSEDALPVCIDEQYSDDDFLLGKISHVGLVEGASFKEHELNYRDRQNCFLPDNFIQNYIPYAPDKLCATTGQNASIWRGVDGSGLVNTVSGRYYLRGILSKVPNETLLGTQHILFTSVNYHHDLILRTIEHYDN